MTRETKIGLLVGLAFIIVIGILLSDHINTTSDPARAQLTGAYDNVTNSVNAPGTDRGTDRTTAVVPNRVEPPMPVRTEREIPQPVRGGATVVDIQPGGDPSQLRLLQNNPRSQEPVVQGPNNDNIQVAPPDNGGGNTEVAQANPTNPNLPSRLQDEARRHNEELVPPGGNGNDPVGIHSSPGANGGTAQPPANGNAPRTSLPAGFREVKAEQNDSVSRLAAKYLGTSNKATREAVIKANPSLAAEPHMVIAGKTYIIPPFAAAAAGQPVAPAPQPQPQPQGPVARQPQAPAPQPGVTYYTVKENDNLWKIAAEQLGSGTRWAEIRDLNQDVLKGGDGLQLNMRLKLPPKAVASNN